MSQVDYHVTIPLMGKLFRLYPIGVAEAAKLTGRSKKTIRRLSDRGRLRSVKMQCCGSRRMARESIETLGQQP